MDDATRAACEHINRYYAELGPLAPKQFSKEESHAILVLADYIRTHASPPSTKE